MNWGGLSRDKLDVPLCCRWGDDRRDQVISRLALARHRGPRGPERAGGREPADHGPRDDRLVGRLVGGGSRVVRDRPGGLRGDQRGRGSHRSDRHLDRSRRRRRHAAGDAEQQRSGRCELHLRDPPSLRAGRHDLRSSRERGRSDPAQRRRQRHDRRRRSEHAGNQPGPHDRQCRGTEHHRGRW